MQRMLIIFGIFSIFVLFHIELNNAVTFRLTDFVCDSYNKSWMVKYTCRLRVMKRNQIGAYFNGTILHPANDISIHFQLFKRASGYKPWLYNARIDGCRFMKNPYNPLAQLILSIFLDFTNIHHECPFVGTQLVDGLYLRAERLRLPFPTGDYKLAIGWYFDKKLQFETNASFAFVENLMDQ